MIRRVERAEVVVVGGGPAGSALAAELGLLGRDVLIVDRAAFPRDKPCGECLSPGGVRVLARLGLHEAVEGTCPVRLRGWSLVTTGGRSAWAAFPPAAPGWGIERGTLDAALLAEARRRGARVIEGVHVRRVTPGNEVEPAGAMATGPGGETIPIVASLLVGADGLRSVVAREIGAVRRRPRLRKVSLTWRVRGKGPARDRGHLLLGGHVTVGLAPVPGGGREHDRWNATLVVRSGHFGSELGGRGWELVAEALPTLTGPWEVGPRPCAGPWASGPFDWPVRRVRMGRVLLVGDAAGYYDPLTGQGMYRALRGGEMAARFIDAALPKGRGGSPDGGRATRIRRELLDAYPRAVRRAFAVGGGVQRLIEGVLSRPSLREPALGLLGRSPRASSLLAWTVGDLRAGIGPGSHGSADADSR